MNELENNKTIYEDNYDKIIIAAFLILGFVSAAVASARWKENDEEM